MIMTEVKISYNNEEYTLEELLQKLSSSEEKIKELERRVYLNKYCCESFSSYKKVSDTFNQKEIEEMKCAIDSLKESVSLREENIRLKKRIDELEEEKTAIAWAGIILALMKNNRSMNKNNE